MHGDLQTSDDDHYNKSPHTTTNRTSVDPSHNKPYHKTRHSRNDTSRKTARPKEAQTATMVAMSGNIDEWIKDAKKIRPLPHIEIILTNVQRKRKRNTLADE